MYQERQQTDKIKSKQNNSRRPPIDLQHSAKIPLPEVDFDSSPGSPLNKIVYNFSENGRYTKLQNI